MYDNLHNLISYITRRIEYYPKDEQGVTDYCWENEECPLEIKFNKEKIKKQKGRIIFNDDFILEQFKVKMKEYPDYKIIGNPKIIIADEPTGNLDSQNSHEILSIFKKMNENHITIIMVSHDPLIASYSSRLLYLKDGKIEKELFKGDKTQQEYFKEIVSINSKEMQKMLD